MDRELFSSRANAPATSFTNRAGGAAYEFSDAEKLAQYCATGTFGGTFYVDAKEQVEEVRALTEKLPAEFVARCAVYARKEAHLKDVPAFLVAMLSTRKDPRWNGPDSWFPWAFERAIDNFKMVSNFCQIIRSGAVGRKNFGHAPRRLVQNWLAKQSPEKLFRDSVGHTPSLHDVIRMTRPKPADDARRALYAYLIGKTVTDPAYGTLPYLVQEVELFKAARRDGNLHRMPPDVPFQMLDSLQLSTEEWAHVARRAPWQMTRMNLNTFKRHGVLADPELVQLIANRLMDREAIARSRVLPYQLLAAYKNVEPDMPELIKAALEQALEAGVANVPRFPGKVVIALDTSGSMQSPITGRRGAPSKIRCVDIAGLMGATIMRRAERPEVYAFDTRLNGFYLDKLGHKSVMHVADVFASFGGGGTDCSLPMRHLAESNAREIAAVIYVSDNESWSNPYAYSGFGRNVGHATAMMDLWRQVKRNNPRAKLVCIDVTPATSTQAPTGEDRLNIGGFNDRAIEMAHAFIYGESLSWVEKVGVYGD